MMLLSALPNIALALVLAYLLLSVLTTIINEFISTTLKLRSNNLMMAIRELVDDKTIRTLFYESGLIKSTDVSAARIAEKPRPSYIDGKTFAGGLLNALGHGGAAFNLDGLKARIEGLTGGLLKDSLKSIIATSAADLISVQTGIANWFDGAMDRLSGDYVRMMKWISLVVGLVLGHRDGLVHDVSHHAHARLHLLLQRLELLLLHLELLLRLGDRGQQLGRVLLRLLLRADLLRQSVQSLVDLVHLELD